MLLTALAASASAISLLALTLLSAWLLQLRRVRGRQFIFTRQQLVDGFGKCQLDSQRVLISFWQLSEYLLLLIRAPSPRRRLSGLCSDAFMLVANLAQIALQRVPLVASRSRSLGRLWNLG